MQSTTEFRRTVIYDAMFVGDALTGPAFGERNKSKGIGMIVGIVASIATMGAAMPMLAATSLGSQIIGGVMMAGGVLSGVGAITGNKKLSKIGGVLSLAGGIGAMAQGAGAFGTEGMFAPGSGSEAISKMSSSFMESVNETVGAKLFSPDVIQTGKDFGNGGVIEQAGATTSPVVDQGAGIQQIDPATGGNVSQVADNSGMLAPGAEAVPGELPGATPKGIIQQAQASPSPSGVAAEQAPATVADAVRKPVEGTGLGSWVENNKTLAKIGAEAIGGFAKMGFGPDQQAQLDAQVKTYNAQAAYYDIKTETERQQLANSGKQVAMISVDDPDREAKIKDAGAKGIPIAFIPNIGTGGVKAGPNMAAAQSQQVLAQTPVRQPTYAAPTP